MEKLTRRKFMELTGAAAVVAGASSLTGCCWCVEEIPCELKKEIEIENGIFAFDDEVGIAKDDESVVLAFPMAFYPEEGKTISVRANDFQLNLNGENAQNVSLYVDKHPGFYLGEQSFTVTTEKGIFIFAEFPKEKWKDVESDNLVTLKFFCDRKCYVARTNEFYGFSGS